MAEAQNMETEAPETAGTETEAPVGARWCLEISSGIPDFRNCRTLTHPAMTDKSIQKVVPKPCQALFPANYLFYIVHPNHVLHLLTIVHLHECN